MDAQQEINALETRIAQLKGAQLRCQHDWGEATFSPYTKKQERLLYGQYERHGVHMYPQTVFEDVSVPRWSRTCKKCGLVQHTETVEVVTQPKKQIPKFGS